jgi:hypothetical protein
LVPTIADEPSRHPEPRFALPKLRRLYRRHPDEGHYSLVRDDDDDWEDYEADLYEYDCERMFFKRYQPLLDPLTPLKPRRQKIEREPEAPVRRRFFVRHQDGSYAPIPRDQRPCSQVDQMTRYKINRYHLDQALVVASRLGSPKS